MYDSTWKIELTSTVNLSYSGPNLDIYYESYEFYNICQAKVLPGVYLHWYTVLLVFTVLLPVIIWIKDPLRYKTYAELK